MAKKSKAYREAIAKVPSEAVAPLEAMKVVKEVATKKFDETVEVHFRLGIDTRQADQQLRGVPAQRLWQDCPRCRVRRRRHG